jgi:hypothetical protein
VNFKSTIKAFCFLAKSKNSLGVMGFTFQVGVRETVT